MISVVDVAITASNPAMPLFPWRAFINSPSSLRIRNVPKRIGDWNINKVYVTVAYPDNSVKTANCLLVGGVWVCTVEGCGTSGFSGNGYTVFADGKDENGNNVTGYVLGKGDITILEADGQLHPGADIKYVHIIEGQPSAPKDGDVWRVNGSWYIYQDNQAWPIGDDSGLISELSAEVQTKADKAELTAYALSADTTKLIEDSIESLSATADAVFALSNDVASLVSDTAASLNVEISKKADVSSLMAYATVDSLSAKQDKLNDAQISAIDSVVSGNYLTRKEAEAGYTEWVITPPYFDEGIPFDLIYQEQYGWVLGIRFEGGGEAIGFSYGPQDVTTLTYTNIENVGTVTATRCRITPTKTSQLSNDGSDGVHPFATIEDLSAYELKADMQSDVSSIVLSTDVSSFGPWQWPETIEDPLGFSSGSNPSNTLYLAPSYEWVEQQGDTSKHYYIPSLYTIPSISYGRFSTTIFDTYNGEWSARPGAFSYQVDNLNVPADATEVIILADVPDEPGNAVSLTTTRNIIPAKNVLGLAYQRDIDILYSLVEQLSAQLSST